MQKLEEEVSSMLMSVKDSIDYLNEKMECFKESEAHETSNQDEML